MYPLSLYVSTKLSLTPDLLVVDRRLEYSSYLEDILPPGPRAPTMDAMADRRSGMDTKLTIEEE
jgi:hypothetical protein